MDWKTLKGANGPATKVPKTIPELTSSDSAQREQAFMDLLAALVAPGKWFPASAPALELLGKLIGAKASGAHRALLLVGEIVGGEHTFALGSAAPAKAAHPKEVVLAAAPLATKVTAALGHDDAATRVAAAFALACFASALDPKGLGVEPLAERAISDPEVAVRASASIALGALARAGDASARKLVSAPRGEGLALGGATIGALIAGVELPNDALAHGLAAFAFGASTQDLVPWGGWNQSPLRLVEALLSSHPDAKTLAPAAARAAGQGSRGSQAATDLVDLALKLAGFHERFGEAEVADVKALDADQRSVAEALVESGAVLRAGFGLPGAAACMRRWLGKDEATALEHPGSSKKPLWLECRALLGKKGAGKAIGALILDKLDPVDRLRVKTALLFGDYRLLKDAELAFPPEDLAKDAAEAGALAVGWAHEALSRHLASPEVRAGATAYAPRHSLLALQTLVAAGEPIRGEWVALVPIVASARAVLEKAPAEARQTAALEKIDPKDLEGSLKRLAPLLDLVGSRALVEKVDEARKVARFAKIPPDVEAALAKLRG